MAEAVVVAEAGEVAMDSIVEDQVLFQADLVEDIKDRLDIIVFTNFKVLSKVLFLERVVFPRNEYQTIARISFGSFNSLWVSVEFFFHV